MVLAFIVLLLFSFSSCDARDKDEKFSTFQQRIDHFNPLDVRVFEQRYFETLTHFKPTGPIILNICGERKGDSLCNGDFVMYLANEIGAAVVSLEHRHYGGSIPLGNNTVENLKYLTIEQALNDLEDFREFYQDRINQIYKQGSNAWLAFGASYSGALSAWFKLKFPHLVRGSIASSAVLNAIEDYEVFDAEVSSSPCGGVFQEILSTLEERFATDATRLKKVFGVPLDMGDKDFLLYLGDAAEYALKLDDNCGGLLDGIKQDTDVEVLYANFISHLEKKGLLTWKAYHRNYLRASTNEWHWPWYYQSCTQFGFFKVAATTENVRSSQLNHDYFIERCHDLFNTTGPNVDETNLKYGGTNIAGKNIVFINSSKDFWRHATKLESSVYEPCYMISCDGCGHRMGMFMDDCDVYATRGEDNMKSCKAQVERVHNKILDLAKKWVQPRVATVAT